MTLKDLVKNPDKCDELLIKLDTIARTEYPTECSLPTSNDAVMAQMREAIYQWAVNCDDGAPLFDHKPVYDSEKGRRFKLRNGLTVRKIGKNSYRILEVSFEEYNCLKGSILTGLLHDYENKDKSGVYGENFDIMEELTVDD